MAPSPEYDKEPKAPDKSAAHISSEDTKQNSVNEKFMSIPERKTNKSAAHSVAEIPPHINSLDEHNLKALLDEVYAYKNPKDRETKSSLFKELLEEVEQDEQACEAAARNLTGCRGSRRGGRGRKALPNSNSLQDLVAALAAEPLPKRHHTKPQHQPAPATVSAKTKYGGSLPSGVDTSSLLVEEGGRLVPAAVSLASEASAPSPSGSSYLATVRCVNPPPLAERRVSASDANCPQELEALNRRSKPAFPVTYTARATLEIGSGSVGSGRAVTTTTASNQVRTALPAPRHPRTRSFTYGPPERIYSHPLVLYDPRRRSIHGGGTAECAGKLGPRGPPDTRARAPAPAPPRPPAPHQWDRPRRDTLDQWYRGLAAYSRAADCAPEECARSHSAPIMTDEAHRDTDRRSLHRDFYVGGDGNLYRVDSKYSDNRGDISLRKNRGRIGKSVTPTESLNPRNVKCMTIGKPLDYYYRDLDRVAVERKEEAKRDMSKGDVVNENISEKDGICIEVERESGIAMSAEDQTSKCFQMHSAAGECIELEEIVCHRANNPPSSFTEYLASQEKLLAAVEAAPAPAATDEYSLPTTENNNNVNECADVERDVSSDKDELTEIETIDLDAPSAESQESGQLVPLGGRAADKSDQYIMAELPNNAYIFLTLPKRLLNKDRELLHTESNNNKVEGKKRKKNKVPVGHSSSKRTDMINRNALRVLLFENLYKDNGHGSSDTEVDSAIPFSCITTPEVVASCNTTPSSSTAVAVDPKPLQLGSAYRAVSSVTSAPPREWPPARASTSADSDHDGPDLQPRSSPSSSAGALPLVRPAGYGAIASTHEEYRKTFDENGNTVQQPPTVTSPVATSSSSSSQKKPRRKKSSKNETVIDCRQLDGYMGDKDDVNELLRFIENAETRGPKMRAKHKDDSDDKATKKRSSERRKDKDKVKRASSLEELSRTKLEDLTARSAPAPKPERRSWGDATPSAPESEPEPKPPTPLPEPEPEPEIDPEPVEITPVLPIIPTDPNIPDIPFEMPVLPLPDPVVEQADFQTVTKKRKPRRRTDEPPRRTRQPSPRRQESAPPSDRSNDSNDDMDSVHSLPQPVIPPIPHASYADIARTRSNIPDLIESCNYYTEGETNGDTIRRSEPIPTTVDSDGYPALETRIPEPPPPVLPRRNVNKQPPPPRRDRKVMLQPAQSAEECPPDVVSDRPPVILLDSTSKPRDMDGVTFGFDINEQLLGGPRRVRCDLVRGLDTEEAGEAGAGAGLRVRAACRALRYLPPPPPADPAVLHHLIDYVHTAWEDIIRCDGGKVRYFSE